MAELSLVQWIASQQRPGASVLLPAGDDLAILKWAGDDLLLVGVDQVLDGVHFDSAVHLPEQIGRKVMNRNLSDCAAMACLPAAAVVSIALPRGVSDDFVKRLYGAIQSAGEAFDCPIVGGDTGSWNGKLAVTVSILGRSAGITPIRRSGARPGNGIYVTGPLGGSIHGRHLDFVPRIREARELAQTGMITAIIDISDGLSLDLHRLCQASGVGARIDAAEIPIHPDITRFQDSIPPVEHALSDGEDHELLFTARPEFRGAAKRIGEILEVPDVVLDFDGVRRPLLAKGWEHRW